MKNICLIILLFISFALHAQVTDSGVSNHGQDSSFHKQKDTTRNVRRNNNIVVRHQNDSATFQRDSTTADSSRSIVGNANSNFTTQTIAKGKIIAKDDLSKTFPDWLYTKPVAYDAMLISFHTESNAGDLFFYCLLIILFFLGLIKLIFPKYFQQVFQFMLQPNVRRRNLREINNTENITPSLLLNFLFVITSSLCVAQLIMKEFSIETDWKYWVIFAVSIAIIYSVKFIVIKISGWIFSMQSVASTYNYVVFSVNKILGVILIPIIILVAYGNSNIVSIIYSASGIIIGLLLLYRYIASFILIRGTISINPFYFFLYLCAIEILPLFIIYKIFLINKGKFA